MLESGGSGPEQRAVLVGTRVSSLPMPKGCAPISRLCSWGHPASDPGAATHLRPHSNSDRAGVRSRPGAPCGQRLVHGPQK